jgi:GntR family transcriptional regulator, transcriptional repressor for pyruvate dehydrogenase complex
VTEGNGSQLPSSARNCFRRRQAISIESNSARLPVSGVDGVVEQLNNEGARMSILKPVSRITLGEQVAAQLSVQIAEGKWKPGEKLPSESELCLALNIGRSTLREALKSLAFVGMVQMRPGDGTYVIEGTRLLIERIMAHGLLKTDKELQDVGEARLLIERETTALAAERADSEDLRRLDALMEEMKESLNGTGRDYVDLDVEFHLAIAQSSKNQMLFELLTRIRGVLKEWISKSQELPGIKENALMQHARILSAIRNRDPEKARNAMLTHLQTCEKMFSLLGRILITREPAATALALPQVVGTCGLDSTANGQ